MKRISEKITPAQTQADATDSKAFGQWAIKVCWKVFQRKNRYKSRIVWSDRGGEKNLFC